MNSTNRRASSAAFISCDEPFNEDVSEPCMAISWLPIADSIRSFVSVLLPTPLAAHSPAIYEPE